MREPRVHNLPVIRRNPLRRHRHGKMRADDPAVRHRSSGLHPTAHVAQVMLRKPLDCIPVKRRHGWRSEGDGVPSRHRRKRLPNNRRR